jgi:hypothetical protein
MLCDDDAATVLSVNKWVTWPVRGWMTATLRTFATGEVIGPLVDG